MAVRESMFLLQSNQSVCGAGLDSSSSDLLNVSEWADEERIIITNEDLGIIVMVNNWGLGQCVTILGLIVNVLNVVTFVKQGVKDSVNISLFGLTISDLGSLFFHFLVNLCWTPSIVKQDLPFYPQQIMYFFVWVHILFTRVTIGLTAWITFERCICIIAPLKIKSIITPKKTITFIFALYVTMIAAVAPMFYTTRLTWIFDAGRNKYVLGVTKIHNKAKIESAAFWGNNLIPTTLFILIVIFTIILVNTLRRNSKWRQKTTSLSKGNNVSSRDTKISKMVLIISAVFILCYLPGAGAFLCILIYPWINYTGKQKNLLIGIFFILFHLECINASVNFFIYFSMSSKFKATLKELLRLNKTDDNYTNY